MKLKPRKQVCAALVAVIQFFLAYSPQAAEPPLANLKMWLRADQGVVSSDGTTVEAWEDQGGNVLNNGIPQGTPILTSTVFPNGTHPTISLDGASSFLCDNVNDLDIPEISIYVVASVDTTVGGGSFLANLRGGFGFSLETDAGALNFYTGLPVVAGTDNLSGGLLENNVPTLITGTFQKDAGGDIKTLYVDGGQRATVVGAGLNNATGNRLTVGVRGGKSLTGQIAEILAYSSVSPQQQQEVELYLRTKYFGSDTGPVVIRTHPVSREVAELNSVTFSVVAEGAPPLTYQWQKDGDAIVGAISPLYTIPEVRRSQAGTYTVVVANGVGPAKTSDSASLTVIPDDTKPTVLSADRDFAVATKVNVSFSERVAAATANVKDNYAIQPGVTVDSAQVAADGKSVVLTTSAINPGSYTLTVNNVQDIVGNAILANSTAALEVESSLVPTKNLKLWLRGDAGVITSDGINVDRWEDQAPGLKNDGVPFVPAGPPQLEMVEFPTGTHPVMRFGGNGGSGFRNDNPGDLRDTEMTIYLIGSISEQGGSRIFIGNYVDVAGWGLGISDGVGGRIKWFTAPPHSMEPAGKAPEGADLELNVPYLITADYSKLNGGTKHMYLASESFPSTELLDPNVAATDVTLGYAGNTVLTVGVLSNTGQRLRGTIAEMLVYASVDANQRAAVEGYLSRKYFGGGSGEPVIVFQPQSKSVSEFSSVTFQVSVDGASPFAYKWFKDGVEIPGAESSSYSLSGATRLDAGSYTVLIDNPAGSKLSDAAVLTIKDLDTTPPTLVSARQNSSDTSAILVRFSERLDPASVPDTLNYTIQGVVVSSAAVGATTDSVVLTTTPSLAGDQSYTLTVSSVADRGGNAILANSSIAIKVFTPFTGTPPPSTDLLAWFKADAGITTSDFSKVTGWADQAAGLHNATTSVGTPLLTDRSFPSGDRPVVTFDGGSGLFLENPQDFDLADISVYVVAGINNSVASQEFIAHWPGWAFGISDGAPGRVKWVTHGPDASLEPAPGGNLPNDAPSLLTGTFATGGDKKFYVDGSLVGTAPLTGLTYDANLNVAIGMLFKGGAQFLKGYIAEILVYTSVSDEQRAQVEEYLRAKYVPDRTGPTLVKARRLSADVTQVRVTFSESLLAAGANLPGNYTISGGTTVSAAALEADGKTVVLTTSGVSEGAVLTVNGVADGSGNLIALNSQISIDTTTYQPSDFGLPVNGFQDDFTAATRDPRWVAIGPDVYTQADGMLHVRAGGGDPNHLVYNDPSYEGADTEILGRIRVTNFNGHEHNLAGVATGVPLNSLQLAVKGGMNLLLLNPGAFGGAASSHARLLSDYTGFGPEVPGASWNPGDWVWLRLRHTKISDTQATTTAKVWPANGETPEPSAWQVSWDTANPRSGFAGIRAGILSAVERIGDYDTDYLLIKSAALPLITPASEAFPPATPRVQDGGGDGLLVLEAENADRNNPAGGTEWAFIDANVGFSGRGAMVAAPDAGRNINVDISVAPRLDFDVRFVKAGTHYIWVRGLGDSAPGPSASDSVNVGIDGTLPATSDRITGFTGGAGFVWTRATLDTLPPELNVAGAGAHVISVWMREDGLIVDKILLTTNPNYIPNGLGPVESQRAGVRLSVAWTATGVQIGWDGNDGTLESAPTVEGPWTPTANQANPQIIATANSSATFYRLR